MNLNITRPYSTPVLWTALEKRYATPSKVAPPNESSQEADREVAQACTPTPEYPVTPPTDDAATAPPSTKEAPQPLTPAPAPYELDRAPRLDSMAFPNPPKKTGMSPASTIPNIEHLLRKYGITVRYDVIKKKYHITMPGHSGSPDNYDTVALTQINSLALMNGMSTGPIPDSVAAIGDRNLYNPVAEWIESKPWDNVDRLPTFYATLTEREGFPPTLKETLMFRWMVSAVAAVFEERGFSCRGVLTLQGAQGLGKTRWSAALVSDPVLRKHVVKLGHHLDASDKDSQIAAITNWLVEIGELDGSLRRDIARLKGFLTLDQDRIRRPYGRTESEYPRRTVFCATVNDSQFLVDPTGNTRWWTIPVVKIDYAHGLDMQQVWAQVRHEYERGAQWWLTPEEERQLADQNDAHRTESYIREEVVGRMELDRIDAQGLPALTSTQVLKLVGIDHPSNAQMKECCGVLRELLGDSKRIQGQQKWRVPVREVDTSALEDAYRRAPGSRDGDMDDVAF